MNRIKHFKAKLILLVIAGLTVATGNFSTLKAADFPYKDPSVPLEQRIDDLLGRMTLEEKIDEICGKDFMDGKTNERLGIPPLLMTDGPHGIRDMYGEATCFPTLVAMGSTWNEDLMRRVGVALGRETRAKGRNLILGPCINIHRTPLGGRNFESFGEDPYLVGKMAAEYVKGVQSQKIGTSTKHFAANNQEWERNRISVEISERALREIYLPAFKAAVCEADTLTIMGAYNKINGSYCCENSHLLMDILKGEWGFKGFVVSDWWAIHDGIKAANEGCDMEMPGPGNFFTKEKILEAVKNNQLKESVIDGKVRRILRVKYKLGLFDGENKQYKGAANTKEHQDLAREVAENAVVLLKNKNNVLPLSRGKIKSIAVIGPNASQARHGGGGSSQVGPPYSISPLQGLKNKCGDEIKISYAKGCDMSNELNAVPLSAFKPSGSSEEYGLKGEYFNNIDFKGSPALTRVDKIINFDWAGDSPAQGIGNENFSVRWTGKFLPQKSGKYEFCLLSDDGSRLFIDNELIVNNWGDHGPETKKGVIDLVEGRQYDVRIEFYEGMGGAIVKFGLVAPGGSMKKEAVEIASKADAAVLFMGLNNLVEGEGVDRRDMLLPQEQDELIKAVSAVCKNTIVVLINGTPVNMEKWVNEVPAIMEAWYSGMEGGNAVANIIFGDVNPSGKLSVTFPKKLSDNPSYGNYPGSEGKVYYKEGIFVGYRHYDKNNIEPQFPFGHGLSYTEFEYSNLQISPEKAKSGETIKVSLDIKNIGKREGKEVVQLYVRDIESSLERPFKELKGFKKIALRPGENKNIQFELKAEDLSFYDPSKKRWVAEAGEFEVLIGSSSKDMRVKGQFLLVK